MNWIVELFLQLLASTLPGLLKPKEVQDSTKISLSSAWLVRPNFALR